MSDFPALVRRENSEFGSFKESIRAFIDGSTGAPVFTGRFPQLTRAGKTTISLAAESEGTVLVTFTVPYDSSPIVVASTDDRAFNCAVESISGTQALFAISHIAGTLVTKTVTIYYVTQPQTL